MRVKEGDHKDKVLVVITDVLVKNPELTSAQVRVRVRSVLYSGPAVVVDYLDSLKAAEFERLVAQAMRDTTHS